MKSVTVRNETRGCDLGDSIGLADGWWSRLRGLVGRGPLDPGGGLLLVPSRGVHMFGMRYPLDVAMLDGDREVVALYRGLAPGARTKWHGEARAALEVPDGVLAETNTQLGDRISWEVEG